MSRSVMRATVGLQKRYAARPVRVSDRVRWVVVAALLGFAMALAAAPEAGAVTGITSTGSIAFARDHNIWLTSPDGLTQRALTTDGTAATPYHSPTQSGDGNVVVAVQDRGQPGSIVSYVYVMDRQGTLLSAPFAPPQYAVELGNGCDGVFQIPRRILATVSPDGTKIAVDKLGNFFGPGSCAAISESEVYVINLDGSLSNDVITAQNPRTTPLSLTTPAWVDNSRLLLYHDFSQGIFYYDLGTAGAQPWIASPGPTPGHADGAYESPALARDKLATTGYSLNVQAVLRLWTTNGAIPAAPTRQCEIENPDHPSYDPLFKITAPTLAPDAAEVAWVEADLAPGGDPKRSDIYVTPVGDISTGHCDSLNRQLLIPGGSDPDWGPAPVNLPVCPVDQTGTPPDCKSPPASCPTGQTGMPPDCKSPPASCPTGQSGMPPDCKSPPVAGPTGRPPEASTPTGQPPTPPAGGVPKGTTTDASPARTVRLVVNLRSGCSPKQLRVPGGGVSVSTATRLPRSRCQLTLRVEPHAKGRRDLLVKRGKRTIRLIAVIRL